MDKSFNKFIKFFNKRSEVSFDELKDTFSLEFTDAIEIIKTLNKNQYIIPLGDNKYKSTYKAKTITESSILSWLYNNWLSIIAIIISIIALFK
jgi:hypothetical protein